MPCPCIVEPLKLDQKEVLTNLWRPLCLKYNLQYAEYSFANVYLNRYLHDNQLVMGNLPLVRGRFGDGSCYLIPTSTPKKFIETFSSIMKDNDCSVFPIPDQWVEEVKSLGLKVSQERNDADYLFHKERLATLSGRDLSSRRNLLHQLESNYEIHSKVIEAEDLPKAMALLEDWQKQAHTTAQKNDYFATKEALESLSILGLTGRVAYIDGQCAGFSIGEIFTPTTALIHFQKARHDIKGVTPFLLQDFAKNLPQEIEWINAEQDLGIPALRQAKTAYHPDVLLTKWRAHY
jgi:hypothetical protein